MNFQAIKIDALRQSSQLGQEAANMIVRHREHIRLIELDNAKLQRQVEDQARQIRRLHVQIAELKTKPA